MKQFFGWTEDKVKFLKENNRIRGYTESKKNNAHNSSKNIPHKKQIKVPLRSKEKEWLSWNLMFWANEHALELQTEYKFHPEREWRLDYAFRAIKIAVEYEGIFQNQAMKNNEKIKSAVHSSVKGVLRDIEKYNAAQLLGWRIIRITAKDYKTVLQQLNQLLKNVP